jgi:hypothetical protein
VIIIRAAQHRNLFISVLGRVRPRSDARDVEGARGWGAGRTVEEAAENVTQVHQRPQILAHFDKRVHGEHAVVRHVDVAQHLFEWAEADELEHLHQPKQPQHAQQRERVL